jgi:4'-phosphopantetheinyl transferase
MFEASPSVLQAWIARPAEFDRATIDPDRLLDEAERDRAARFKHVADHDAYVLAHALRRCVLARWLDCDPHEIAFSEERDGRPVLLRPRDAGLYFSHSRSREAVAFAVTRVAPVGIDVEPVRADAADEALIARFVVPPANPADQQDRSSSFHFRWTALEAFWKAKGKGLADANPRIECRSGPQGQRQAWLEGDARGPQARLIALPSPPGLCVTIALCGTAEVHMQLFNANMHLFRAGSAHEMLSDR